VTDVSRIVSLSGDFSEIIFALGLGDNLVGVDLSSVYPPEEMRYKPKIGVEFRILAEPILSLEPTLVIGDVDASPVQVIEQIRDAGVPVVIFPRFEGLEAPGQKIRAVGEILGVPGRADSLADEVQAEVDAAVELAATASSRPRTAVVYVATSDTVLILAGGTIFDGVLASLGAEDVGPAAGVEGFVPFTAEAIVAAAPDVIITAERGFESLGGMDGFTALPGIAQTPAGRDGQVLVFEDLYLMGLGPRTGQLAKALVLALHPELTG
jgi:iron complex transport system substrate-binding protein